LQNAEQDLAQGEGLLRSFKNDSAMILAARMIGELQKRGLLAKAGLSVALLYEKLHRGDQSRFFANVSHELRTPLTLILGPIRTLLQESQLTEKQARLLNMTNQSGKQLELLINEILDLQKLEAGKMEIQLQPTELSAFFGSYAAQFGSLAQRKEIDFSFEKASSLPDDRTSQLSLNLHKPQL